MKRPLLFAELCAGTAAVSLKLEGGRHARPPVSRMGSFFAVVRPHVLAVAGEQLQVFKAVVSAIPVEVVHHFLSGQGAPKMQSHHHPMLSDVSALTNHVRPSPALRRLHRDIAPAAHRAPTVPPRGIAAGDVAPENLSGWRCGLDACCLVFAAHKRIAAGFRARRAGALASRSGRERLTTSGAVNRGARALLSIGAGLCVALLRAELLLKAAGERPATVVTVLSLHTLSIA